MNRFKGLDPVDRLSGKLWTEIRNIAEEAATEPTPKKTKRKKANWFIWEGFTNSWEKKRSKRQGRKRKICSTEWTVPEKSKERKEGLLKGTSKMIPDGTKNSMKDGYMEKYIRCFNIILKISD